MNIYELLLTKPELAANIRFEIKGSDLLELSATLIRVAKEQERIESKEEYLSCQEVMKMVRRSQATLSRWNSKKILIPNQLGLYKKVMSINSCRKWKTQTRFYSICRSVWTLLSTRIRTVFTEQ